MAQFSIKDFRYGLDTRRSELTSQPGTMETMSNFHINQGGELEKRRAFVQANLPLQTFGFQETVNNIIVFGSRNFSTGWSTNLTFAYLDIGGGVYMSVLWGVNIVPGVTLPQVGDPITVTGSVLPGVNGNWVVAYVYVGATQMNIGFVTGAAVGTDSGTVTATIHFISPVVYQQLTHPNGANMTGVVTSTYFNNEVFVVTTWDNGDTLTFYNGVLLADSYIGLQGSLEQSPQAMATDLVNAINASGNYTTVAPVLTSLYFQVTGGTVAGGNQIGAVIYNFNREVTLTLSGGGTTTLTSVELLTSVVPFVTDNATTATAVKTNIDGNQYGFTIVVVANKVTITPPTLDGNGLSLGVNGQDSLSVQTGGNVTVFVETPNASFDVISIPTEASTTPFNVTTVLQDAQLQYKLVSNGVVATAPTGAIGQFSLASGTGNAVATASITGVTNPISGNTITIGGTTYTFVNQITGVANLVLIGETLTLTMQNLVAAINATSGSGTTYSNTTLANASATASAVVGGVITLTASQGGLVGNSIVLSQTGTAFTLVGFANGGPDTNRISTITVAGVNLLATYVQYGATLAATINALVTAINNYSGTSRFSASATGTTISLIALDPGASYNGAAIVVTVGGNVCVANCYITVGALKSQNISVISGNLAANMLTATITFQDAGHLTETIPQYCARIVANINANTAISGYVACSILNQIWFSAKVISSSDVAENIQITATITLQAGASTTLAVVPSASIIGFTLMQINVGTVNTPVYRTSLQSTKASVVATGGVPPYAYKWFPVSGASSLQTSPNVTSSFITWSTVQYGSTISEAWQCTVTDSAGASVTSASFYLNYTP